MGFVLNPLQNSMPLTQWEQRQKKMGELPSDVYELPSVVYELSALWTRLSPALVDGLTKLVGAAHVKCSSFRPVQTGQLAHWMTQQESRPKLMVEQRSFNHTLGFRVSNSAVSRADQGCSHKLVCIASKT